MLMSDPDQSMISMVKLHADDPQLKGYSFASVVGVIATPANCSMRRLTSPIVHSNCPKAILFDFGTF